MNIDHLPVINELCRIEEIKGIESKQQVDLYSMKGLWANVL
jgi:hypothetical protein